MKYVKEKIIIGTAITLAIVGIVLFMSIVVVDAGHVGLHKLFGRVEATEIQPGLHLKHPLATVHQMSVRTQEYTMSKTKGEGVKYAADSITVRSKEGSNLFIDITCRYRLNPMYADWIYKNIGPDYVSKIVRPDVRETVRTVCSQHNRTDIYGENRIIVQENIVNELHNRFEKVGPSGRIKGAIILEAFLLRDVVPNDTLQQEINEKESEKERAEKMVYTLQAEQREAERKIIEAQGIKDSTEIVQKGLANSPEYLTYLWLQKLENHDSVVYLMEGNMGLPILNKDIDNIIRGSN